MRIAIIGASGFIGKNLIKELLLNKEHSIVAISLKPDNILIEKEYLNRIK